MMRDEFGLPCTTRLPIYLREFRPRCFLARSIPRPSAESVVLTCMMYLRGYERALPHVLRSLLWQSGLTPHDSYIPAHSMQMITLFCVEIGGP